MLQIAHRILISVLLLAQYAHSAPIDEIVPEGDNELTELTDTQRVHWSRPSQASWANQFGGDVKFECDSGQAIVGMNSEHSNRHEDRRFKFNCATPQSDHVTLDGGEWTDWLNAWDEPLKSDCGAHQVLAGVESEHSNRHEDRKTKFLCRNYVTNGPEFTITTHKFPTTGYLNRWDRQLDYTCPYGSVMLGMESYHSNRFEDRRFKAVCTMLFVQGP